MLWREEGVVQKVRLRTGINYVVKGVRYSKRVRCCLTGSIRIVTVD